LPDDTDSTEAIATTGELRLFNHLKRLSRLCADKTTLYQTITGFQPSIGRHFVAFHTISTTDPEEPLKQSVKLRLIRMTFLLL